MATPTLRDGSYDASVLWIETSDDAGFVVELVLVAGAHKGETLDLVAVRLPARDELTLVGLPCTLVVEDGVPRVEWR